MAQYESSARSLATSSARADSPESHWHCRRGSE